MPCMDGGPSREQVERDRRNYTAMAKLACAQCRDIEQRGGQVPEWAREWWEQHQADDREREEREAAARVREQKQQAALAKLNDDEIKLLNLHGW